jgi:agmatine deiminase
MGKIIFPAEWNEQSAVQLTWPHKNTDWAPVMSRVIPCFVSIAHEIAQRQKLIIICQNANEVRQYLHDIPQNRLKIVECLLNDTWARDHGAISVLMDGKPTVYDFRFNGWGLKFPANYDNLITRAMYAAKVFSPEVKYCNMLHFILEGGSIESDGQGSLLTTSECLLSPNRNGHLNRAEIEKELKLMFGLDRVLWLDYGYLSGDDTDSHIDTLARFCSPDTIAYVRCTDKHDEHYDDLQQMEQQLKSFTTSNGKPYRLIPLPMANAVYDDEGTRLPATYANFLIINKALLLPVYGSDKDNEAVAALNHAFPNREIVPINCLPLILQHGSLHCVTMQYPVNFVS